MHDDPGTDHDFRIPWTWRPGLRFVGNIRQPTFLVRLCRSSGFSGCDTSLRHAGYFRLEALITQDVIAICGSTNFSDEVQVSAFVKQASVIGKTRYLILAERRAFCVRCQPVSARTLTSRADHGCGYDALSRITQVIQPLVQAIKNHGGETLRSALTSSRAKASLIPGSASSSPAPAA